MTYMAMSYRHLRAYFAAILIGSVGMLSVPQAHAARLKTGAAGSLNFFAGVGCDGYLVGRRGAQQIITLGNGCLYKGTVQHEFLHASGITHEQERSDRDTYVVDLWDNIPWEWESQYAR